MKKKTIPPTYIWQRTDWRQFVWDAQALLAPLARLTHLHGQLVGQMSMLERDRQEKVLLQALTSELTNSSEIEGVQLSADSVRSSIARRLGISDDGLLAEDHYVEGLVGVMLDAVGSPDRTLTEQRLYGWHAALFPMGYSGCTPITVAHWRVGEEPMQVVSGAWGHEKVHYEAPPSERVPAEMACFLQALNESTQPPAFKAALAHLWFVTIHPFDDGNGRIARTLSDFYLAEMSQPGTRYYSMSAAINRHKKAYYEALEAAQRGTMDITPWLLWFFSCLEGAIAEAAHTFHRTLDKAVYWERFRHVPVNERQRKVINRLWADFDGKLTSSKWAKMCHCSQDTALRDLNDLVAKGMLRDSGEGGRSKNYLLPLDVAPSAD